MKDQVSIARIAALHPKVRDQFTSFLNAWEEQTGLTVRIVQGVRTFPEQQAIYDQGRTIPGKIVTYAKPGQSFHNFCLACDCVPFRIGSTTELDWGYNFRTIEPIAIANGLECGMNWPEPKTDLDHFQNSFGYDWQELLDKYNANEFILGTQFLDI